MATTAVLTICAVLLVRAALEPLGAASRRLRACEEHLAFVSGAALDHVGWLYGTPRRHDEPDDEYRRRVALARAQTFAV